MSANLLEHFAPLEDPRVERNKRHVLPDILLLTISAVLGGAEGWEAIEEFGQEKLPWLRKFAPFENGVPSHDCIANVISRLRFKPFQECFVSWVRAVAAGTGGEVVAVDGKTARGSRDRGNGRAYGQCVGEHQPHGVGSRGHRREIQRNHGDSQAVAVA